jgi:hypothetical protein
VNSRILAKKILELIRSGISQDVILANKLIIKELLQDPDTDVELMKFVFLEFCSLEEGVEASS